MQNCKANHILDRSSHRRCSVRKDVLRNFAKFTEKHLCHKQHVYKGLSRDGYSFLKRSVETLAKLGPKVGFH